MNGMGAVLVFAIVLVVFGIGGLALLLEHFQKLAKIKANTPGFGNVDVEQALDSLRREIADLRDTTTRYDLSFDSALQRLESRVANLEQSSRRISSVESPEQSVVKQTGI